MNKITIAAAAAFALVSGCTTTTTTKQSTSKPVVVSTGRFVPTYQPPVYAPYGPGPAPYGLEPRKPLWQGYVDSANELQRQIDADAAKRDAEYARTRTEDALNQIQANQRFIEDRLQYGY
jgi:hypothetical protein